ncbi:MAG: hypothetical protein NVS9B14_00880 [Candidatus Acidiferrum sp.]
MAKTVSARTFAARLVCPRCDTARWLTLANRTETFNQILELQFEFECREHGPQKGAPVELLEVAPLDEPAPPKPKDPTHAFSSPSPAAKKANRSGPRVAVHVPVVIYGFGGSSGSFKEETETVVVNAGGALVRLKAKLSVGDTIHLIDKLTGTEQQMSVAYLDRYTERESRVGLAFKAPMPNFWRRPRRKPRVAKTFRVKVKGQDAAGRHFIQTAFTVDLSQDGARLEGVGMLTSPGQTVQVRRLWRQAKYRVVWVGQIGTAESNQVGLFALESGKNIWNLKLPANTPAAADRKK